MELQIGWNGCIVDVMVSDSLAVQHTDESEQDCDEAKVGRSTRSVSSDDVSRGAISIKEYTGREDTFVVIVDENGTRK